MHVDALRHDYVNEADMPFLNSLASKGAYANIIPPFGFEPDGAYLTGTYPEIYEGGVHFIYNEGKEVIPFTKFFPGYLDKLNIYVQYPFRKFLEYLIKHNGRTDCIKKQPYVSQIPFKFLKYFYFNEDLFPFDENFGKNAPSLYDYIKRSNKSFFYASYPQIPSDANSIKNYLINNFHGQVDFLFLMISDLDKIGHDYGPNSNERKKCAKLVDDTINEIYNYLFTFYDEIDFIAFGDHGMVGINNYIDFANILKGLPLIIGKDYFYFLDSTFARFWFLNNKAEKTIYDYLKNLDSGTIVTEKDKNAYKINYKNRKFGDLIFWVNDSYMIYPNFWQVRNKKKGMHGYRVEVKDNHSAFVFYPSNGKTIEIKKNIISMQDVFHTAYYSLFNEICKNDFVSGEPIQKMNYV